MENLPELLESIAILILASSVAALAIYLVFKDGGRK